MKKTEAEKQANPLQWKEELALLQASIPAAIAVLERHGFTFIFAGENERVRRKELRAQGIRKIQCVPWTRAEYEAQKHEHS